MGQSDRERRYLERSRRKEEFFWEHWSSSKEEQQTKTSSSGSSNTRKMGDRGGEGERNEGRDRNGSPLDRMEILPETFIRGQMKQA